MRKLACFFVLVVLLSSCASATPGNDQAQPDARDRSIGTTEGQEPTTGLAFVVDTFDGDRFSLAEHRGTPVVINFWESW